MNNIHTLVRKAAIVVFVAGVATGTAACGSDPAAPAGKPAPAMHNASSTTVSHDFPRDPHCFPQLPCGPR